MNHNKHNTALFYQSLRICVLSVYISQSESHNLKYVGIDALSRIIKINPDFAEEHQLAVIDCLEVG